MPEFSGCGVLTLSQIVSWDSVHLERAASDWACAATQWEDRFSALHTAAMSPGGTVWEGEAADIAQERSFADLMRVRGFADALHNGAYTARRGADELHCAKRRVLDAVADAEDAGFVVEEDLSVTPPDTGRNPLIDTQRVALAEQHAATIAARAGELSTLDRSFASMISAATAPLADVQFADPAVEAGYPSETGEIQLVDSHIFKDAPAPDPGVPGDPGASGAGPGAADIRGVIDKLPVGDKPWIHEVRSPRDLDNLWKWMRQNGTEVLNGYGDPVKGTVVTLPDGTRVGQRFVAESTGRAAIDIKIPGDSGELKIHINPKGGVPQIPSVSRPAAAEVPLGPARLAEPPVARGTGAFGGFGGALPDDALPHLVEPPKAGDPDLPIIGDGRPDYPGA